MEAMIDLETLSLKPNAYILSIGAVKFNDTGIKAKFFANVRMGSGQGFHMDPQTVEWWLHQESAAQQALMEEPRIDLKEALMMFAHFMEDVKGGLWGNGSDFDNLVLKNAYEVVGLPQPWSYKQNRCYRTIKNLYPHIVINNVGVAHKSVDDAESQALHLIEMLKEDNITL